MINHYLKLTNQVRLALAMIRIQKVWISNIRIPELLKLMAGFWSGSVLGGKRTTGSFEQLLHSRNYHLLMVWSCLVPILSWPIPLLTPGPFAAAFQLKVAVMIWSCLVSRHSGDRHDTDSVRWTVKENPAVKQCGRGLPSWLLRVGSKLSNEKPTGYD